MTSSSRFDTDQQGGDSILGRKSSISCQSVPVLGIWMTPNKGAEPPKCINSTDTHKKACFLKHRGAQLPNLTTLRARTTWPPVFTYWPSFELVLWQVVVRHPEAGRCKESHSLFFFFCKCLLLLGIWGEGKIITFTTSERGGQKPSSLNRQERSLCPRWVGGSRAEPVPGCRFGLNRYPVRSLFIFTYNLIASAVDSISKGHLLTRKRKLLSLVESGLRDIQKAGALQEAFLQLDL